MGPDRGAQRRRFGEPGLSSAASNSMGRFNVAPHAMPLKDQGPGAAAVVSEAQPPAPQRSSQAKPAPMAPTAPGSSAGPASCDVMGLRHHPAEGGEAGRGPLWEARQPRSGPRRPLLRKWNDLGGEFGHQATSGRPPPPPLPLPGSHPPPTFQSQSAGVAP